jgi:hypothetical protein
MPRRKPKMNKVVEEKIKETLDSIIMDENLDAVETGTSDLPRLKTSVQMDYMDEKISSASEAKSMLDSLVKFYFDENLISSNSYLDYRKKIDSMNVSSMMFQLKTAQHAITKILEEIDMGNMTPRLFEVLAQLQGQIIQMSKDHQQYLDKMEKSYKVMKDDIDSKNYNGGIMLGESNTDDQIGTPSDDNAIRVRGTRGLMEGLRGIIGSEVIDIKAEEVNPNSIVNAREKMRMDAIEKGYETEDEEDDDDLRIEDDLFNA